MKTKLTIAMGVMTAALFLVVPSAAPKGKPGPSGTPLSMICVDDSSNGIDSSATNDYCTVTASATSGISSKGSGPYSFTITNSCGDGQSSSVGGRQLLNGFNLNVSGGDCTNGTITFTVTGAGLPAAGLSVTWADPS